MAKRWGGGIGVGLAVLLGVAVVRGSIVDRQLQNPASPADGIHCQVYEDDRGQHPVRCAMVLEATPAEVMALVHDYDHYAAVFEGRGWHVDVDHVTAEPDGRVHLVGQVRAWPARWPLDVHVQQAVQGDVFTDTWDEPAGYFRVNRGSWTVSPLPGGHTLAAYALELDIPGVPAFAVRDGLLIELSSPMRRIGRRLRERREKR
jgi:hypothetical protein